MQSLLATVLVIAYVALVSGDASETWKQNIEYYENVHLDCSKFNTEGTIHSVQAWILPSGEIRSPQSNVNDNHIFITDNGFSLRINRLDDNDFGIYYCIVDKGVNYTGVIKIGVNVDGAYYGPEFLDELTNGWKVGAIAAGCTLVTMVMLWCVCTYFSRKRSKFNHERRANLHLHEIESARSGDDSVYYIADGMAEVENESAEKQQPEQQQRQQPEQPPSPEVNRGDRLLSSTSDHYHSIGTLEKTKKPNEEEGGYDNTAF